MLARVRNKVAMSKIIFSLAKITWKDNWWNHIYLSRRRYKIFNFRRNIFPSKNYIRNIIRGKNSRKNNRCIKKIFFLAQWTYIKIFVTDRPFQYLITNLVLVQTLILIDALEYASKNISRDINSRSIRKA